MQDEQNNFSCDLCGNASIADSMYYPGRRFVSFNFLTMLTAHFHREGEDYSDTELRAHQVAKVHVSYCGECALQGKVPLLKPELARKLLSEDGKLPPEFALGETN